eukprot:jgi/Phyca11/106003/e_gw1.11.612.1
MQRVLGGLDFRYVKGEKKHMYANSEANIAFRNKYLQQIIANRVGEAVDRPEVYLDESFCNANHVRGQTWLSSDNIRYNKSGKGDRYLYFISIQCWNEKKKKQDETEDYHRNFNSELFEAWFENVCKLLRDQYGGCNIHMDGAGYH